jgi:hypothetical protein
LPTSSTVSAYAATSASAEARFAWSRFSRVIVATCSPQASAAA